MQGQILDKYAAERFSSTFAYAIPRTHASDDCIIPVVNAISRGEFDEFTTRFYEGTKRTDGRTDGRLAPVALSPPRHS